MLTITQFFQSYLEKRIGQLTQRALWIVGGLCLLVAFYQAWLDERVAFEGKTSALQVEEKTSAALRTQNQEVARLRAELDQREKRKAIRNEMSRLLDEANKLRQALLVKEEKRDLVPSINAWVDNAYKYLRSVESSYASRFNTSASIAMSYGEVPIFNTNMINFLDARIRTLSVILGELRD